MSEYEKLYNFLNLYKAHRKARLGKQENSEVILFEMDLAHSLIRLSDKLKDHSYQISDYYSFTVHDPKERVIYTLHYPDRVVQHCLCDEIIPPVLEPKLIYDNAACRTAKGTHFAINRLTKFMSDHAHQFGINGWVLKCDIRKYFDNIDHAVLKQKLRKVFPDPDVLEHLEMIIDSYHTQPGIGLPLGNQSSQWFALYYLDELDRYAKEKLRIKRYVRYMDDFVLIHPDKEYMKFCRRLLADLLENRLHLEFNQKTQIIPLKNGIDFLGFHFYLSESGKVIRKVRGRTKTKYHRRLKQMQYLFSEGSVSADDVHQVLASYKAHLDHGHTWKLQRKSMSTFFLTRRDDVQ